MDLNPNSFTVQYAAGKTVLSEVPATLTLNGKTLTLVGKLTGNESDTVIFELPLNDIKRVTFSSGNLVIFWTNVKKSYGIRPNLNVKDFKVWLKANLAKNTKFPDYNKILFIFWIIAVVVVVIALLASNH